ncbi:MAG TPA: hypothetical protein VNI57_05440 [Candidatus Saccharimonadales bacterium]|nr:hypothetical protein [Candidatus Saccharimonadales bacterium]
MPATRLQPLPFPEPERFIAFIEEEPSLLEPGLRIVAKRLPLPGAGPGVAVDLLALDSGGRVTAIDVREVIAARSLETAAAARSWLRGNLSTVRALCPALAGAGAQPRSVIIGGRIDPAADVLLGILAPPHPTLYQASLFDSPTGPAISFRTLSISRPLVSAPSGEDAGSSAPPGAGDPLAGIPLTADEVAEFRRLVPRYPVRHGHEHSAAAGAPPDEGGVRTLVEN